MAKQIPEPSFYEGYHQFGCTECGDVYALPSHGTPEDRPWCTHHGNYSWHGETDGRAERFGWTRMEYITATVKS